MKTPTPTWSLVFKTGFHAKLVSGILHTLHEWHWLHKGARYGSAWLWSRWQETWPRSNGTCSNRTWWTDIDDDWKHCHSQYIHFDELQGDQELLLVFGCKNPVIVLDPTGWPVPERGVETKCWLALYPVLDDVLPWFALWTMFPAGATDGNIWNDKAYSWEAQRMPVTQAGMQWHLCVSDAQHLSISAWPMPNQVV